MNDFLSFYEVTMMNPTPQLKVRIFRLNSTPIPVERYAIP